MEVYVLVVVLVEAYEVVPPSTTAVHFEFVQQRLVPYLREM